MTTKKICPNLNKVSIPQTEVLVHASRSKMKTYL